MVTAWSPTPVMWVRILLLLLPRFCILKNLQHYGWLDKRLVKKYIWGLSIVAITSALHADNKGSIPLGSTKIKL